MIFVASWFVSSLSETECLSLEDPVCWVAIVFWWKEAVVCSKGCSLLQDKRVYTGGLALAHADNCRVLPRRSGLNTRAVLVGFVVDKATETGFH